MELEEMTSMKTFIVTYEIEGYLEAAVDAETLEEAMKSAEGRIRDADFGEVFGIRGEAISVDDLDGNNLWEITDPEEPVE